MVGWHHQCSEHELGQTPGGGEGQGSLAFCSPWGCDEQDMTRQLNNNKDEQKLTQAKKAEEKLVKMLRVDPETSRLGEQKGLGVVESNWQVEGRPELD